MRKSFQVAAWVVLVALACGAAAPKGEKPTTRPTSRPSSPIAEALQKDGLKMGMSEAEAKAALERASVRETGRKNVGNGPKLRTVITMSDGRQLGFEEDRLVQISKPSGKPSTRATTRRAATQPH